ncbi:MAG: LuxR C-terminal-related transcriptional regulator [Saprospiraceae bacterium]
MKRTIWLYGLALAVLTSLLKGLEYRYHLRDLKVEFYIGLVAVLFTGLGIWVGLHLTRKRKTGSEHKISPPQKSGPFEVNEAQLNALNISRREYEVLALMAAGCSNQEIADQLFISLNTVKSHSSNIFAKLEVRRRTQAVQRAKLLGLIE